MWATCPHSASAGYHSEFYDGYQKHTNPLNCRTSSSEISDYHADFHEGHGTVGEWQGHGMCELTRHGMAWTRHDMCELAFNCRPNPDVCSTRSDVNFKCPKAHVGLRLARLIDLAVFKCIFNDTDKCQDYTASMVNEWMSTGKRRHDTGNGNKRIPRKHIQVPLCSPKIPEGLVWHVRSIPSQI
jgi:hypothetical protein